MKKILPFLLLCLLFSACDWFKAKPEIGIVLAKHFKNKLYKKFDTAAYHFVFEEKLQELTASLSNPIVTRVHYTKNEFKPTLITNFYPTGELDSLKKYIERSRGDGFNPHNLYFFLRQHILSCLKRTCHFPLHPI